MPHKCVVQDCRGNSKTGPKVRTFGFPKERDLRLKWIHATKRYDFEPTRHSRVCELHFEEQDIELVTSCYDSKTGREISAKLDVPRLRKGAIPSKLLGDANQLSEARSRRIRFNRGNKTRGNKQLKKNGLQIGKVFSVVEHKERKEEQKSKGELLTDAFKNWLHKSKPLSTSLSHDSCQDDSLQCKEVEESLHVPSSRMHQDNSAHFSEVDDINCETSRVQPSDEVEMKYTPMYSSNSLTPCSKLQQNFSLERASYLSAERDDQSDVEEKYTPPDNLTPCNNLQENISPKGISYLSPARDDQTDVEKKYTPVDNLSHCITSENLSSEQMFKKIHGNDSVCTSKESLHDQHAVLQDNINYNQCTVKETSKEEMLRLLNLLSKTSEEYIREHKEWTAKLINSMECIMQMKKSFDELNTKLDIVLEHMLT